MLCSNMLPKFVMRHNKANITIVYNFEDITCQLIIIQLFSEIVFLFFTKIIENAHLVKYRK